MKVYTKTGDDGTSSLIGGRRVRKNDVHLEIYGTLDELSSFIGLLKNQQELEKYKNELTHIQQTLVNINCIFATDDPEIAKNNSFDIKNIQFLENKIDEYEQMLPPVTDFLIPGENKSNAITNICRTICRRAERRINDLQLAEFQTAAAIYINRLSDYFFVLGRKITY
ncbi:MAG: cob(I)yrinic acid a,c-diamide adenosyltransferase [Paludibacteraceae bacterium]|nr:cob(I)yrinic acid a,c-diamide adenosyltransferase [Paludibacteraceae bacterium]